MEIEERFPHLPRPPRALCPIAHPLVGGSSWCQVSCYILRAEYTQVSGGCGTRLEGPALRALVFSSAYVTP